MRNARFWPAKKSRALFSPILLFTLSVVACQVHHGHAYSHEGSQNGPSTLAVTKPSEREIRMTRVFDAPRSRVYEALTQPELLPRWYQPAGCSIETCEMDVKPGGMWRFVIRLPDGNPMEMRAVYREVNPGQLQYTEAYDNPPLELLVTTTLAEYRGETTMTVTVLHPSQQARNENSAGIVQGSQQIYDKLAEVLASSGVRNPKQN